MRFINCLHQFIDTVDIGLSRCHNDVSIRTFRPPQLAQSLNIYFRLADKSKFISPHEPYERENYESTRTCTDLGRTGGAATLTPTHVAASDIID